MKLEEILVHYKGNIMRVCKMFSKDLDEQKDLFQEICIQLHKALPTFEAKSLVTTFLYRVALNTCLRFKYKYHLDEKKVSLEEIEWSFEDQSSKNEESQERLERLYQCIYRLKEADKAIVLLYLEDLNHKEIGMIIGITENLVAVKMSRIKERLFKCLTLKGI